MAREKPAPKLVSASGPLTKGQVRGLLNVAGGAPTQTLAKRIGVQATQYHAGKGYVRPNKKGAIAY